MFFSLFFVSPGHLGTIKNLIPGWTTIVKIAKTNWQSPSRDPWSNCLINSWETTKVKLNIIPAGKKTIQRQFADAWGIIIISISLSISISIRIRISISISISIILILIIIIKAQRVT